MTSELGITFVNELEDFYEEKSSWPGKQNYSDLWESPKKAAPTQRKLFVVVFVMYKQLVSDSRLFLRCPHT